MTSLYKPGEDNKLPDHALASACSRPPICITHKPGCVLIADRRNAALAAL